MKFSLLKLLNMAKIMTEFFNAFFFSLYLSTQCEAFLTLIQIYLFIFKHLTSLHVSAIAAILRRSLTQVSNFNPRVLLHKV